METTKKLNETPLIEEMSNNQSYVIVDDDGNVSRTRDVPGKYVTETELNDFIKPYDERITSNANDIVDLDSYIDIITPKNTASGELVHVTDALGLPTFETKSSGNVKQFTTSGKQMFNFEEMTSTSAGITTTIKGANLKITGTANSNSKNITNEILNTFDAGTYTFSTNIDTPIRLILRFYKNGTAYNSYSINLNNKSVTFTLDGTEETYRLIANPTVDTVYNVDIDLQLEPGDKATEIEPYTNGASPNPEYPQEIEVLEAHNLFDKNNEIVGYVYSANGELVASTNWNTNADFEKINSNKITISVKATGNMNSLLIEFDKNKTFIKRQQTTNLVTTFTLDKNTKYIRYCYLNNQGMNEIQIIEGTEIKPYLPYGCVGYKVNGKNLINPNLVERNGSYNFGDNGKIPVKTGNNTRAAIGVENLIEIKPNTTYTFSIKQGYRYALAQLESDKKTLGDTGWKYANSYSTLTITTKENAKYIGFNFSKTDESVISDEDFEDLKKSIQLEKGSTATEIEPYKEQIVYLDLKGNWVGAINDNIKDYLVTDKKKYWLVKNDYKLVLDGSEDWAIDSIYQGITQFRVNLSKPGQYIGGETFITAISNYFRGVPWHESWLKDNSIVIKNDRNLRIMTSQFSTVADFKAYLKQQHDNGTPIIVYYALATPEIIELGELPEPIKTFEGVNNIQLLANLDTEIEVVYVQDVKKYIDSKLAEISAQII